MNNGWVKTYRKLSEWEWYKDSSMVHLFIHLITKASHEDRSWRGKVIKRGQMVTSRKILSSETGISEQTIRTCLERLKSTSEITIQSTNRNSIITICNYEIYQAEKNEANQQTNQPARRQSTSSQPTIKQELKELKNIKNTKKEFDLSFVDVVFMPLVKDFIQYRKEIKKAYKTERGVKQFYNELRKLSNGNYQTAKKLVEHAKGKEWQTVYPIKHEENKRYTGRKNHADERL